MKPWEANLRKIEPYVAGEQPTGKNIIKLNTNENPYPPAKGVFEALKTFDAEKLRKYPDTSAKPLLEALAEYYEVDEEEIFIGVGSDDVLAMSFMSFFNSTKPILFPKITYSFYSVWADLFKIPYELIDVNEDFTLRQEDFFKKNGGIVFANPNAPTSIGVSLDFIEAILKNNQSSVVIVDEAYIDFGGQTALPLLKKYDNLLVVQTFSKSRSMAGMRIGYAIGCKKLISTLKDVKNSYNSYTMNMPSYEIGKAALKDKEYFAKTTAKIIATRERFKPELEKLGFSMPKSLANFYFMKHKNLKAKDIFEALKKQNIYVRYFSKPLIDNYLRVTIGTDEEMDKLLEQLRIIIKAMED